MLPKVSDAGTRVPGFLEFDDALHGTTSEGGTYGRGTLFSVGLYGGGHLLFSFGSNRLLDGTNPSSALIDVDGALYGTMVNAGAYAGGDTVFRVTEGVKRTMYGTTSQGGATDTGTIFSVTIGGNERVLYSFGSGGGKHPVPRLLGFGRTLYRTTYRSPRIAARMSFRSSPNYQREA